MTRMERRRCMKGVYGESTSEGASASSVRGAKAGSASAGSKHKYATWPYSSFQPSGVISWQCAKTPPHPVQRPDDPLAVAVRGDVRVVVPLPGLFKRRNRIHVSSGLRRSLIRRQNLL